MKNSNGEKMNMYKHVLATVLLISPMVVFSDTNMDQKADDHSKDAITQDESHEQNMDEHEEHGAHEHGAAHLSIAIGDKGLELALETPSMNVFGFEHPATSDEDKKTLEDAKTKLEQADLLFSINKEAGCQLDSTNLESPLFGKTDDTAEQTTEQAKEKDHKVDEEKDGHANEGHDDGDSDHEESDHKDGGHDHKGHEHSDVDANWTYTCNNSQAIKDLDVKIFSAFSGGFKKLKVDWISATNASTVTLTEDGKVDFN